MLADFGFGVLVLTFVLALYSVGIAITGERKKSAQMVESARRAQLLTFPLLSLASGVLIYLLLNNHYDVSFVYEVTSRSMPTYLKITAWWGGQSGSLLFWGWLLSAFTSAVTLRKWERDREFLPWVVVVSSVTLAFFLSLNIFFENPFARFYQTVDGVSAFTFKPAGGVPIIPPDGQGLNPLLRHPGMIIHPPMLYLGFVSFVIPFAFAVAALVTGRTDDRWTRITRRWTLWAWLFLSLGLVLGGRWAYDVLGWGGYWAWDPVEIAAFNPWLVGTAFLHSVMIQEKRGMLKHWNMVLIILTYLAVIWGTFATRSGIFSSVHSFAQSAIGPMFFAYIGFSFITSVALLIWRWPELKSETEMKSMLSREALFLLNNLIFLSIFVICFWGMNIPWISELFTRDKLTFGPPFYEQATTPLWATLMLLMAIAPLSTWGLSSIQHLGRINRAVLGGMLAIPTVLVAIWWGELARLLDGWSMVIVLWAVVSIILAFLYIFRKTVWQATIGALAVTGYIFATYTRHVIALIGFFLVALVILVTLREFWRAARARQRAQKENFFVALARLTGRNRRRYGGFFIHISMMLMAIGILGIELFQVETQKTLAEEESLQLAGYSVKYKEVSFWNDTPAGVQYTRAVVDVSKNGKYIGQLYPRIEYYIESQQPMTIPGLRSTVQDDLYILLIDWRPVSATGASFRVYHNPLVNWLWIGSLTFLVGMIFAAWPDKDPSLQPVRVRKSAAQPSAAD